MKKYTVITAVIITISIVSGCGKKEAPNNSPKAQEQILLKGVQLEKISTTTIPDLLEVMGSVKAHTSAMVSTRIPGTISVMKVREGDRVKKGQLLMKLDAQENQASALGAEAVIEEAIQALEDARARKKLSDITFERFQKLFNEQAISRQEFDVKQTERELASQSVARAEAKVRQAQQGSKAASTMADYTKITAPISGIITTRQTDLGATVFPSQPLMTIEDEKSYQLELVIPETMVSNVKPGTAVDVTLDAFSTNFTTKIAEVVPAADPGSHTFMAKVNLSVKGLKSGMFGRASIHTGKAASGILIPKKALVERGAMTSVWTVDSNKTTHIRLIKVGKTVGDKIEVLSGLADGDMLIVTNLHKVSEGAKVE